jgi:hypothetical protein
MATRDRKTLVRIDPRLAQALKSAAALEGIPAYQMLESIITGWIATHHAAIWGTIRPPELPPELKDTPGPHIDWKDET